MSNKALSAIDRTDDSAQSNHSHWPSATRENPCPRCGKTNRCRVAPGIGTDGKRRGICFRSGTAEVWEEPAVSAGDGQHHPPKPPPTIQRETFATAEQAVRFKARPGDKLVEIYQHRRRPGLPLSVRGRFESAEGGKKYFLPAHQLEDGAWTWGKAPGPQPLFGELASDGPVIFCEGQKCVKLNLALGCPSVLCCADGSSGDGDADLSEVAGREITIQPDNDITPPTAGPDHARRLRRRLVRLGCKVRIIEWPAEMPDRGDIEQFDAMIGGDPQATRAALDELADAAPYLTSADLPPDESEAEEKADPCADLEAEDAVALVHANPELRPPIIDGLLREREIMNFISASKVGKTFCMMDLALCISTGRSWLERFRVAKRRALYMDAELHKPTIGRRIHAIAEARGIAEADYGGWLDFLSLRGRLRTLYEMEPYFRRIKGEYGAIFIDSIYRLWPVGLDENSNADVTAVYNFLDRMAELTSTAIICVHHASKGSQSNKAVADVGSGAGAQSRAVDTHLILRAHEQEDAAVLEAVARSWPPPDPFCIRWNHPTWRIDESLDAKKLREPGRRGAKSTAMTPAEFAERYLNGEALPKSLLMAKARASGQPERRLNELLALAMDEKLIGVKYDPKDGRQMLYYRLGMKCEIAKTLY